MDAEVDLTGRRVGRFEIRSLLGRGGMGAVYRAWDSNLDRHVAIKILPPQLVADPERVRRFVQEAKSASALNHPNVISIYDIGQDDSVHYIAMELVEGATLREHMAGTALELKRAIAIGEEIAGAIGAAHEAGVIHRDLKPENILVASAGYVKVLDFGLAKLRREESIPGDASTQFKSTEPGKILGTVGYMSPEQAEGKPVDHRSDIFSLGCILYEMVSGRSPFRGRTHVDTMHNIVHAEPAPLHAINPEVPPEMQRIITKSLAKAPEDRYQSAKDLAVDLKRLRRELDSSASVTSEYTAATKRSRASWIAIALIPLLAIVAFALLWRPRETAPTAPAKPPTPLTIRRLTSTGNVIAAAISPDGKYIAYVNSEQGEQSLWLRQLATRQDLQLVPPAPVGYWGHAFSPDGSSIYYAIRGHDGPYASLHVISSLGGESRKILTGIDSAVAFSPDGKQIAFARAETPNPGSSIVIANADGTSLRVLAKRVPPEFFYPIFFTGPSWSPDGKRIAASVLTRRSGPAPGAVIEIEVATGAERVISTGWGAAQHVAWLPDGKELIVIGARDRIETQVWRVPLPSGEPRPITNDLFGYRMITVTADGSTLVTVASDADADLWLVPFNSREAPRKLRTGKAVGIGGVSVAPDGSIAYVSYDSGGTDILVTDASGKTARQLTNDPDNQQFPSFTRDSKGLVFFSFAPAGGIRLLAADGRSRATELAPATYDPPAISPDGQTIVFKSGPRLMKVPASGGPAVPLTDYFALRPAISPDGTRVACYCSREGAISLCIVPMSGGPPEKTLESAGPNNNSIIKWTADGRALLVNTMLRDRQNIWLIPLDGGKPKAVTNFTDQLIFHFDVTPDGKAFIASRGELSRDAVMINGFR